MNWSGCLRFIVFTNHAFIFAWQYFMQQNNSFWRLNENWPGVSIWTAVIKNNNNKFFSSCYCYFLIICWTSSSHCDSRAKLVARKVQNKFDEMWCDHLLTEMDQKRHSTQKHRQKKNKWYGPDLSHILFHQRPWGKKSKFVVKLQRNVKSRNTLLTKELTKKYICT